MASTNKTPHLGLNDWIASDAPMRADFCGDNQKIDKAFGEHCADAGAHLSEADRALLQNAFAAGSYTGDGAASRAVHAGFRPRFGVVYAAGEFLGEYDFNLSYTACGFGFISPAGDSVGLHASAGGFTADQLEDTASAMTVPAFNREGVRYAYILWR